MSLILQAIDKAFTKEELPNHQLYVRDTGDYIAIWPPHRIPDETMPFLALLEHAPVSAARCFLATQLESPINPKVALTRGIKQHQLAKLQLTTYASLWIENAATGTWLGSGTPLATDTRLTHYDTAAPNLIAQLLKVIIPLQRSIPATRPTPNYLTP